jgi:hypothetical protein
MRLSVPPAICRKYGALAVFVIAVTWVLFDRPCFSQMPRHICSTQLEFPEGAFDFPDADSLESSSTEDAFDFPPVESESIKSLCDDVDWNPEVVFTCDKSVGGIGNIRNSILNCVRYAISAGGQLVVPNIILRNPADITHIRTGMTTTMDYMFDTEHFIESLRLSCPQLRLYRSASDIPEYYGVKDVGSLIPESLVTRIPKSGIEKPEQWRALFDKWLDKKFPYRSGQIIVELGRSYMQYPIYSDGEGFAMTFGGILKFRSDTRLLASAALLELADQHSLDFNVFNPILHNAFFGAHLRTEKDAKDTWSTPGQPYSRYSVQSKVYLEQAPRSNSSIIYVASGDLNEVAKFATDAKNINMTVVTKFDLLNARERAHLEKLAWDQQSLVDYLIMLKASDFAGVAHSSFAWSIALKRHLYAKEKKHLDGPQMLSDELSQIYGTPRGYPEYYLCSWP